MIIKKGNPLLIARSVVLIVAILGVQLANAQNLVSYRGEYQYLKGSSTIEITNWTSSVYDDSQWTQGSAPFRYGDGEGGTLLSDMQNSYTTVFLRKKFDWSGTTTSAKATLSFDYDDGFVLWINNQKILERNAPATIDKASKATTLRESGTIESVEISLEDLGLVEGENQLAVILLNNELTSSDVYFDLELIATQKLDESLQAAFSHPAGFYDQSFALTVTPPDGYGLLYTVDGSNPATSTTSLTSSSAVNIAVDPTSKVNRAATAGFIVKAALTKSGFAPSFPASRTYLFVNQVKNQKNLTEPWPQTTNISGQRIDLDIDTPADLTYMDSLELALKDIPTISVSTDMSNLFDATSGIFVHADGHGPQWERPCSVELLNPDGSEGFEINAGLRMRGGYSRNGTNPKHAFRLFFRGEYGEGKLRYPLFGEEGTDEFDKIDLRSSQNYAWAYDAGENARNTLIRDVFSRDLQAKMGHPHSRSRYYHLYINGAYWGLFMTQERAEARFAESYFGGDKEDYDVIKVTTDVWPYQVEATDGSLDSWSNIYQMTLGGDWTDVQYFKLQGRNAQGEVNPDGEVMVDIDNLIDYMMVIFYTGNCDAPVSSFSRDMANNFYLINDRTDKTEGYKFLAHDSEHSLMYEAVYACTGLYENRVALQMNVTSLSGFHPQWLHKKLTGSPEYRQRFADRAAKLLATDGLFTPERLQEVWDARADQIDLAIIANAIRWGGAQVSPPRSKKDWLTELNKVRTRYFPYRSEIFKNQLVQAKLLTTIGEPQVLLNNEVISDGKLALQTGKTITIKNQAGGVLYYTLDGTDPRQIGGDASTSAMKSSVPVELSVLQTTVIKARTKVVNDWGPLREIRIVNEFEDFADLKITELNYHPLDEINGTDTTSGSDFEFIEFQNTGEIALNLSGLQLDSAVRYTFPENTVLQPGAFYVIASKTERFFDRYGQFASGNYQGNLSNSGERLVLVDAGGNKLMDFSYSDKEPWPVRADGEGYSLVWSGLNLDPDDYRYWQISSQIHGNPFDYEVVEHVPLDLEQLAFLRINELNYHPLDGEENGEVLDGDAYEFMEFINTSPTTLNVSGVMIDSAVAFTFPNNTLLIPEVPYVIASDYERFRERYGLYPDAVFQKNLSNSGERIILSADGQVFMDFTYNDKAPWPEAADGGGYSLTWNKLEFDPGDYRYWTLSSKIDGTPFINENIVAAIDDPDTEFLVYPIPAKDRLNVKFERPIQGVLTINDLSGKTLFKNDMKGKELTLKTTGFPKGTYIMNIQAKEGIFSQVVIFE